MSGCPVDVLALPATAITAPLIAPLEADDRLYNKMDWLHPAQPHVRQPVRSHGHLAARSPGCERPVGFMLVARHGQDRRLLEIAASVERKLAL